MTSVVHKIIYPALVVFLLITGCTKDGASATSAGAGGSLAEFAIVGNYLYAVDAHSLHIIDITDPGQPKDKGIVMAGFDIETIFPYKDKLYLGSAEGMYIFSIADPAHPVKESAIQHFRACDPVVSNDSVSYVTLRSNGSSGSTNSCGSTKNELMVYDSRVATNPQLVTEVAMTSPYGLGLNGNALYVCEGSNGLTVFDLTDPWHPAKKQTLNDEAYYDVIPYGNVLIAYIDAGVAFFDVSDPLKIIKAGELKN